MAELFPVWRMSHCIVPTISPLNLQKTFASWAKSALLKTKGLQQEWGTKTIRGGKTSWGAQWPPGASLPRLSLSFGTLSCSTHSPGRARPEWLSLPILLQFSSVQFSCSVVSDFATPWIAALQAFLSITNSRSPPKPMSIELVMPSNHLILCCPFFLPPSIFPSIRIFSNESALHIRWPKYWSFSFNISSSKEHPGLISFRMDWLDLLAVQGTLKGLLQHHSTKASILQRSAFFIVQLSHLYMATGKTIALTRRTFVGKVMSLLFNMLSRLVITFLLGSKCLLTSWLQSPSAVILEPRMCIYKRNPGRVSCVQPWWVTQAVEEVI